jgi:hypothetical protein
MTMKSWLGVIGVGMLTLNIGCARETPLSPSEVNDAVSGTQASELTTTSPAVVTLLPDLTVDPPQVTVREGYKVMVVNKSGRYAVIRSANCSEFNMMNLPSGRFLNSSVFRPAGKTCDYYAWDVNWSQKIFVGQVAVQ